MDLLKKTQEICEYYNIKPARSRGQNFLIRENIYDQIVEIADLNKDDVVLEVGPGLGFLTEKLARKTKKVIAVELDDKLANVVEERMKEEEIGNVEIINDDILKLISKLEIKNSKLIRNSKFEIRNLKVVANLPYNITSIFLRKILSGRADGTRSRAYADADSRSRSSLSLGSRPLSMTLMLQKEVADRIVAKPGKMSKLAVSVQFYADAEIIDYVNKENFWPQPKVDSAIVNITPYVLPSPPARKLADPSPDIGRGVPERLSRAKSRGSGGGVRAKIDERKFFQLVKYGFSAKRKMLKNNLAAGYRIKPVEAGKLLKMADFRQNLRAQELNITDWLKLFGKIEEIML